MKKKQIAVYTCIMGNYDELEEIDNHLLEKDVDYYCFTNNKEIISKTWKIIYVEDFTLSNLMLNRKIKILGHELINSKYSILVYVDGNCHFKKKITELIKNECDLEKFPLYAFKHSVRDCIYDEAESCIQFKKETKKNVDKILEFYRKNNFPKKYGLCEMGCFIKKIDDSRVMNLMSEWYEMLEKYSKRDQLSFMWCAYKMKFPLGVINLSINNNEYIEFIPHKKKENIKHYRLYFGNSNEFCVDNVIDGIYIKNENNVCYIEKLIVPCDTTRIEFEPAYFSGIEFKNFSLELNGKKDNYKIEFYNYYNFENRNIFYNDFPVSIITGDFHKGDSLDISIELILLDKSELLSITNKIDEKLEIIEVDNTKLKEKITVLQHDKDQIEEKYNLIVTSKGWKVLEKIREVMNAITHR